MNPLLFVAGAALLLSRGRSVPRGTVRTTTSNTLPPGRRTWRGNNRDEWAKQTWDEIAAALPTDNTELFVTRVRALVAAALTSLAARETGWGRSEHEHNLFSIHATGDEPRFRSGSEVLAIYPNRRAGVLAGVRLLTDSDRYRPAFDVLVSELARGFDADASAARWVDAIIRAGFAAEPRNPAAFTEESRSIAAGVLARLRRAGANGIPAASTPTGSTRSSDAMDAGAGDAGADASDAGDAGADAFMRDAAADADADASAGDSRVR